MSLDELTRKLESALLPDGTLDLSDAATGLPVVGPLLRPVLHNSVLNINAAHVTRQQGAVDVMGKIDVLSLKDVDVTVDFRQPADIVQTRLDLAVPLPDRLRSAGFSADNVCLSFTHDTGTGGDISALLHVAGIDLPVNLAVQFPGSGDSWYVAGNFESGTIPLPGFASLVQILGDPSLAGSIPAGLDSGSISLADIGLVFNPTDRTAALASWKVQAPPWQITPDFTIHDVAFSLDVTNPLDRAARTITAAIQGAVTCGSVDVAVQAQGPDADGNWTIGLGSGTGPGQGVDLPGIAELVAAFAGRELYEALPAEIQGIQGLHLRDLTVVFNPAARTLNELSVALGSGWDIVPGEFAITDGTLLLRVTDPLDKARRAIDGSIEGTLEVDGVGFRLSAALGPKVVLSGAQAPNTEISLAGIVNRFLPSGASLPPEVPDVTFSNVAFSLTPKTGEYTLGGASTIGWMLPFGVPQLAVSATSLHVSRGPVPDGSMEKTGPITASVSLMVAGPVIIVPGLTFGNFNLAFDLAEDKTWKVSSELDAVLFDTPLKVVISVAETAEARTFTLAAGDAAAPFTINLGSVAALSGSKLKIVVSRALGEKAAGEPGADAVQMSKGSPYTWSLTAVGGVRITSVFDGEVSGKLALHVERESVALAFKPDTAEVSFNLPQPHENAAFHADLSYLSLKVTKLAGKSQYAFDTQIGAWFTGLSGRAGEIAPSAEKPAAARFQAGGEAVKVTLENVADLPDFAIPPIPLGNDSIDLGKTRFEVSKIEVDIAKPPKLAVEFAAGIPEKANSFFGEAGGKPLFKLLRTYDPNMPDSLIDFTLGLSTKGLTFECLTSPFAPGLLSQTDQPGWWLLDLGAYGAVQFEMPIFNAKGNTFAASGAFKMVRPLKLPLKPFKLLLEASKLPQIDALVPAAVPIDSLQLTDSNGKFDFAALGRLGFPSAVQDALRQIDGLLDRLPQRLRSYLGFTVPDDFSFSINVSLEGAATIDIKASENQPIRLLWPAFGVTGPQLMGMELRSFSVGELLSGVLTLVKADVTIDVFDLVELIAALALPADALNVLPDPKTVGRTLIIKNLFMPVVVETVIPVPVPLFIDQFGIEYQGLEGLAFQFHAGFHPTGSPGLDTGLDAYHTFRDFFTKHDALLDPKTPPGVDLVAAFGPNFIRLPKYLGGGGLGSETDVKTFSLWDNLAHALNAMKTLNLAELLAAIPLEDRSGAVQGKLALAAMTADAEWLVATPEELKNGGYQRIHVSNARLPYLQALSALAGDLDAKALMIYLHGGWHAAGLFDFDAALGLLAGSSRFAAAFDFSGKIANFVDAQLRGMISVAASARAPMAVPLPAPAPAFAPARRYAPVFQGPDTMIAAPDLNWAPDAFTVEWWLKPFSHRNWNQWLGSSIGWGGFICHTTDTGAVYCGTDVATRFTPGDLHDGTVQIGAWQHFAFTYDHGAATFYKNGVPLAKKQNMTHPAAWQGFGIGGMGSNTVHGEIADVRIWGTALGQDAIRAGMFDRLAGSEPGLQAYWPLDDGKGTTAADLTGRHTGKLTNVQWIESDLASVTGLSFDGQSAIVTMPGITWAPQAFTVEWWINPLSHHNWSQSVHGGAAWGSFVCHTTDDGAIYCGTDVNTRFTPGNLPAGTLELNTWQHFAFTFDHGAGVFYKNGVALASKSGMLLPVPWAGFQLGAGGGNLVHGQMAEVRLWNQALPAASIQAGMFRRLSGSEPGLVGYWPLDDGSGTVAHDRTAAGHDGQVQSAMWARPGRPSNSANSPVQLSGYAGLSILKRQVFTGSVGLAGDSFWLTGSLDLFPGNKDVQAMGDLQGWISGQQFYLAGRAAISLFGMVLAGGTATMRNGSLTLDGTWLNGHTLLAIREDPNGAFTLHGNASWWVDLSIDFGKVTKAITNVVPTYDVTLADKFRLDSRFSGSWTVDVYDTSFGAYGDATYTFNGQTFTLTGLRISVGDPANLIQLIKAYLTGTNAAIASTFQTLFDSAESWLHGVTSGAITWFQGVSAEMGKVFDQVYGLGMAQTVPLLDRAGYQTRQVGQVLSGFGGTLEDTARALILNNYTAEATTEAVRAITADTYAATAALRSAGYQVNDVCLAMKNNFTTDGAVVGAALKQAGYDAEQIKNSLTDVFVTQGQNTLTQVQDWFKHLF